ncbi:chondroitin proteoglycan 2-like [Saccostrea echinata]|uniref:chondroitin proteoglycan 2-like n=1 Tax=Saccostrea echinata TaxID=191078 RepID=UPI002A7FDA1F|nr:chondroitin proteoglycan 2-like [Saccostrea echinata]
MEVPTIASLVLFILFDIAFGQNCVGRVDGVYDAGCRAYTTCKGGVGTITECKQPNVFNRDTNRCDDPANVHEICGTFRDCDGRDDGRYPDVDRKCQYYFTCFAGKFMGHNPCPASLVFNYALQTCDYITDMGPPCGVNPNMTSSPLGLVG